MTRHADLATRLEYAVAWVRGKTDSKPLVGVILGSGLGAFADRLLRPAHIPYQQIPGFPESRVAGHAGRLVVGELDGPDGPVAVAAMQGRVHGYEGWPAAEVAFGARVLCSLGVRALLVTNAAGGINPEYAPGELVRLTDHLNLTGQSPLTGPNDDRLGPRFPDLSEAYDRRLGQLLEEAARQVGLVLRQGVYAGVAGPAYETPAEIRMLRTMGADLVGMSTVHEVIAARHQGVPVAGLSVVTNLASGLSAARLSHEEVQLVADRATDRLTALLSAFLPLAAR
ncbi:MAG: purine-nucleoside phosphorylase [Anaeromyxobacter sp.]|nr:purine-nucleoside phosphorylase [Anaeromyxobacter sp.]MBL0276641.1 purine-nucleoside phosphorylase [Anaeromyxobacter sp.]